MYCEDFGKIKRKLFCENYRRFKLRYPKMFYWDTHTKVNDIESFSFSCKNTSRCQGFFILMVPGNSYSSFPILALRMTSESWSMMAARTFASILQPPDRRQQLEKHKNQHCKTLFHLNPNKKSLQLQGLMQLKERLRGLYSWCPDAQQKYDVMQKFHQHLSFSQCLVRKLLI